MSIETYRGTRVGVYQTGSKKYQCARCGTSVASPSRRHGKHVEVMCKDCRWVDPKFLHRQRD